MNKRAPSQHHPAEIDFVGFFHRLRDQLWLILGCVGVALLAAGILAPTPATRVRTAPRPEPLHRNFENCLLIKTGLLIVFDPYAVWSYARGSREV